MAEEPKAEMLVTVVEDHPRIKCTLCGYDMGYGKGFEGEDGVEKAKKSFQRHLDQHGPGRTPDIWVTLVASGRCSACNRLIECEVDDEELVWCSCGASWGIDGTKGRTDRDGGTEG